MCKKSLFPGLRCSCSIAIYLAVINILDTTVIFSGLSPLFIRLLLWGGKGKRLKKVPKEWEEVIFQIIFPKQYNDAFIFVLEFYSHRSTTLLWAWGSFNSFVLLWCCPPQRYISAVFLPVPPLALIVTRGASMEEACRPGWKPVTDFWWDEEQVRCFHNTFVWRAAWHIPGLQGWRVVHN